jgi:tetratricopeptide (TPR) repeat protein
MESALSLYPKESKLKPFTGPVNRIDRETLSSVCNKIILLQYAYDDVAEELECKAFQMCGDGHLDIVLTQLKRVADFYEKFENKNEEICRDLSDVYLLIGQMFQFTDNYMESIDWFSKSTLIDDQYSVPYHNLAISYRKLGKMDSAIRSLEHEINLAPGNYYSYLLLCDFYEQEKMPNEFEDCLKRLLSRDPDNMQGLYRLIKYYEKREKETDLSLLVRRILNVNKAFNKTEALIRIWVLCKEKKFSDAIEFSNMWQRSNQETSIMYLVSAYLYGILKDLKNREKMLSKFLEMNKDKKEIIQGKLNEFATVFGQTVANRLKKSIIQFQ